MTDQHSQVQLYTEGPFDKIITFLEVKNFRNTLEIPRSPINMYEAEYLCGQTFNKLIASELKGTEYAVTKAGKMNMKISIETLDAYAFEMCIRDRLKNLSLDAPRILYENGIEFAIMSDHPVGPTQYLPVTAALCVKHGLPERAALAAITINAARAVFLEERIGSLEVGKDADLVLFAGDPLDVRTKIAHVFINGERIK